MRLDYNTPGRVRITLSERNLYDLQAAFELKLPAKMHQHDAAGVLIEVGVESNAVHYLKRQPGPGIGLVGDDHDGTAH